MEIDLFFSSLNEFKILISRITHFWKIDAICAYLNIVVSSNRYRLQYKWHIFSVLLIRTTLCVYWYVLPVSWLTSSLICLQACFDNQSDRSHSRWKESISEWSRCGSFLSSLGYRVPGCSLLRTGVGVWRSFKRTSRSPSGILEDLGGPTTPTPLSVMYLMGLTTKKQIPTPFLVIFIAFAPRITNLIRYWWGFGRSTRQQKQTKNDNYKKWQMREFFRYFQRIPISLLE